MRSIGVTMLAAALVAPAARAHDFWIEPTSFHPAPNRLVGAHLRVGEGFPGEAVPRDAARIVFFVLKGRHGETPMVALDGADPAGAALVPAPGLYAMIYRSAPRPITLEPARFEAYLREEGLERIAAVRAAEGQTATPGREVFSRCAKALVLAGPDAVEERGADAPAGCRLELIAERNPYALAPGEPLPVRLLLDGRPLEGALIRSARRDGPPEGPSARTDASGRAALALDARGFWRVTSVHMDRAPDRSVADWESVWASLTFDSRPGAPLPPASEKK